jgi:hypothetical protein
LHGVQATVNKGLALMKLLEAAADGELVARGRAPLLQLLQANEAEVALLRELLSPEVSEGIAQLLDALVAFEAQVQCSSARLSLVLSECRLAWGFCRLVCRVAR